MGREFSLKPAEFFETCKTIPKPIAEYLNVRHDAEFWQNQNQTAVGLNNFILKRRNGTNTQISLRQNTLGDIKQNHTVL